MNTAALPLESIAVGALRVGMFVHLEGGWMSHPFPLSSFRIANAEQLAKIAALGVKTVRWSPLQSDPPPSLHAVSSPAAFAAERADASPAAQPAGATPLAKPAAAPVRARVLADQRERQRVCEQQFAEATRAARSVLDGAHSAPQAAAAQAVALTGALVDKMLVDGELCIRLLNDGGSGHEREAAHAINVSVVSLLLGRALGLGEAEMRELGLGALLHDLGKAVLPPRLRYRDDSFSTAETRAHEEHVALGVRQARAMGIADAAVLVIAQHHEHCDGSGYPSRFASDRLSTAARIVAMVNRYDTLCNPAQRALAHTPHEAVALLFAQGQQRFDSGLLGAFIRMMGIYPPGSPVQLTDARFALVVGVNSSRPLKPRVIVHDAGVPRDQALVLDLDSCPGLGVLRSIKPQALPPAACQYLAPRQRVSYFFEPDVEAAALDDAAPARVAAG